MKQIHFLIDAVLAVAIIVLFFMIPGSSDSKTTSSTQTKETNSLPIAFVRMDSLASQYEYFHDLNAQLNAEAEQNKKALSIKVVAMQKAAEDFQRRLRMNAFTSEEAARNEQERILKMQEEGQKLELSMSQALAVKQAEGNEKMYKIIQEQIAKMNKDGKYRYILTNVGLENLLYADSALDITDEVVKYLNDHYNKEIKNNTDK